MNKIFAIAAVVIKELYRRKDFYVLFILTALITAAMWIMNFFHDDQVIRFIKEICLALIWISALVIAITTAARQIPAERESRTIFPLLAKPIARWQVMLGQVHGMLAGGGGGVAGVLYLFRAGQRVARPHAADWGLCAGILAALANARNRRRDDAVGIRGVQRAFVEHDHRVY